MLSQARAAAVPMRIPYATQATAVDPDTALLQLTGEVRGDRALIIGANALDIMCALIRKGAAEVNLLRQGARPERAASDLAVATDISSQQQALSTLTHARRALAESGRVVLRTITDPAGRLGQSVAQMLRLQGFSAVRVRRTGDCTLVTGALPWFGPCGRALAS